MTTFSVLLENVGNAEHNTHLTLFNKGPKNGIGICYIVPMFSIEIICYGTFHIVVLNDPWQYFHVKLKRKQKKTPKCIYLQIK